MCHLCALASFPFCVHQLQLLCWVINFDVWGNHSILKHCPPCNSVWHLVEFATKPKLVDLLKTNKTYLAVMFIFYTLGIQREKSGEHSGHYISRNLYFKSVNYRSFTVRICMCVCMCLVKVILESLWLIMAHSIGCFSFWGDFISFLSVGWGTFWGVEGGNTR